MPLNDIMQATFPRLVTLMEATLAAPTGDEAVMHHNKRNAIDLSQVVVAVSILVASFFFLCYHSE